MEKPSENFENKESPKLPKITLENWRDTLRGLVSDSVNHKYALKEGGYTVDEYLESLEKADYSEFQTNRDYVEAIAGVFDNTDPSVLRRIPSWAFFELAIIGDPSGKHMDLIPMSPELEQMVEDSHSADMKLTNEFLSEKGLEHGDSHPIPFLVANNLQAEFEDWKFQKQNRISLGSLIDRREGSDDFLGKN
jgi:hypothetical protein